MFDNQSDLVDRTEPWGMEVDNLCDGDMAQQVEIERACILGCLALRKENLKGAILGCYA